LVQREQGGARQDGTSVNHPVLPPAPAPMLAPLTVPTMPGPPGPQVSSPPVGPPHDDAWMKLKQLYLFLVLMPIPPHPDLPPEVTRMWNTFHASITFEQIITGLVLVTKQREHDH